MAKRSFLLSCSLGILLNFLFLSYVIAQQPPATEIVTLIAPAQNQEAIMKHLNLKARFNLPVATDSLTIILDDSDITVLLKIDEQGIQGILPMLLKSGAHTLYISGNSSDGPFTESYSFSSRQYAGLDEAYTINEWDTTAQAGSFHSTPGDDFDFSSLDSVLSHQSTLKLGGWQARLFANARLLEQSSNNETEAVNKGSIDPEHQGLDLNNILFQLQYQGEKLATFLEVGDIQVEGTQNTFSTLSRNGVQAGFQLLNFYAQGFSVYSKETFGLHDGIGLGFDDDEYLYGISGGYRFWEDRFDLRVFYIDGGQQENSYSSWSQEEGNRGDLYGVQLLGNLWEGKLNCEFEYDRSDYDPYTSDEFSSKKDKAWRLQLGGQQDTCSYNFDYEYFGPDYNLPGDLTTKKDYEGFSGGGSKQFFTVHTIGIMFASYHDNVDSNELYARTNSYAGQIDYAYSGFSRFPLNFSYRHTRDKSEDEPEFDPETDLRTDTISFSSSYTGEGPFSAALAASYTWQNDKTERDADTTTFNLSLSPSWNFEKIRLSLNGTLNQNRNLLTDVRTDDYIFTFDASGSLLDERLDYEFGGTYNYTAVNNDYGDCQCFSGYSRVNYHLPWLEKLAHPVVGLEFQYNVANPEDVSRARETRVLCTLSTSVPFIF
ncbi:MAG: hypothetical protein GXO34_06055 [Deltaproteobacteria bacterium]|nr:hypothetical protein [Deltaproteobacteria bacterium]